MEQKDQVPQNKESEQDVKHELLSDVSEQGIQKHSQMTDSAKVNYEESNSRGFQDDPEVGLQENASRVDMEQIARDFKSIRLFLRISGICGPVSLIFGGALLGTVGLIFGILAFRKVRPYTAWEEEFGARAQRVKKFALLAILICIACITINIVFVFFYYSELSNMLATGGVTSGAVSGSSSTWG